MNAGTSSSSSSASHRQLHIAVVSSPGMGHFIPVLVLANRLAGHHAVRVTVLLITTADSPPASKLPQHHHRVHVFELPPVEISHLVNPSTRAFTKLCLMVRQALPFIRSAIAAMDPRPDALIVSYFGNEAAQIAVDFNMTKYVYFPCLPWFIALTVYCPVLDQEINGEYVDQKQNLIIPGCKPLRPEDVVDPMCYRSDLQYEEYVKMGKQIPLFDGILSNSWEDLDSTTLKAFRENETLKSVVKILVYPIGPLTRPAAEPSGPRKDYISWLDRQPAESVIFVSFGSGGVLSQNQITELAWGLELSRQRFLWVVRRPTSGGRADDAFFGGVNVSDGTADYLPDGFLERTGDVGLVVLNWAGQVEILNHSAVGGFLSHCGWNSTLESITGGVAMIAWPLYAEQKMNAAFLVEEAGVAMRVPAPATGEVVGREEIAKIVRALMEEEEGKKIREKVKLLKISGEEGLKTGGASHRAMSELLSQIVSGQGRK